MRIPVFRSRSQGTNEAPGARITARMDARPFIQAELAKGKAIATGLSAIGEVAKARLEDEARIQYNESLLAAEEEMRVLADKYKNSPRLGDVINEEGTGAWQVEVNEIRTRMADNMISREMTNAFNARFGQQELSLRFQLQDQIKRRIQARANAASAARQKSLVAQLSDHRASLELLPMLLASNDAELASDVQTGRITPQMRALVNQKIIDDIANGAATSFVGSDPTKAIKLARALEYQDMVDRGEMSQEDAAFAAGLDNEAAYTMAVLQLAPRNVALQALGKAVTNANKLDGVLDEIAKENEDRALAVNKSTYNSIFGVDPNAPASTELTQRLSPGARRLIGKDENEPITGREYIDASTAYLDQRNYLSPEQRRQIVSHRDPNVTGPFAKNSDPSTFAQMTVMKNSGTLTIDMLDQNKSALSLTDYTSLAAGAFQEADQSLSLVDDAVASAFKYNKLAGATDELSKAAEASYASVSSSMLKMYNERRAAGNPMTSVELNSVANQLVAEQRQNFVATIQQNLTNYIGGMSTKGIPSLTVGNELQELDAWYNSLAKPTNTQQSIYTATRAEIERRIRMMREQ